MPMNKLKGNTISSEYQPVGTLRRILLYPAPRSWSGQNFCAI